MRVDGWQWCNTILPLLHVLVVHLIVQRQLMPSMYTYVTSVVFFSDLSDPLSLTSLLFSRPLFGSYFKTP
jgi:hypothetical protein